MKTLLADARIEDLPQFLDLARQYDLGRRERRPPPPRPTPPDDEPVDD